MPVDPAHPDLAVSLPLDPYAPRAARQYVAQIDRPSPDLRDAVMLLSSELVTHAVEQASAESIELRAWMPGDVVRVEVRGLSPRPAAGVQADEPYRPMLLDQIADRWSVEDGASGCTWFEIDRHPEAPGASAE